MLANILQAPGAASSLDEYLPRALRAVRTHLGMKVAFVSEFTAGRRVFRAVDAASGECPVAVGGSDPLEESFCQRVVDGRLPGLIRDARENPEAMTLPVTKSLPVGAHLSVPIQLGDGRIYGTFCCFSNAGDPSLTDRDLAFLRAFADLAAELIDRESEAYRERSDIEGRIESVLASADSMHAVYQPIYHLNENRTVGFEALSRFDVEPRRTPDVWFGEAARVGRGVDLELKAMAGALAGLQHFPESIYIGVNVAPETVLAAGFREALRSWPLHRIVLEITEHSATDNYADIARVVAPLRSEGLRLAVDDAGAGYASFRHILSLAPDIIKLDISLTRDIDLDPSRRSLAKALIGFANATGSRIVAEGVERREELTVLRTLGVAKAQGYFIAKPMSFEKAVEMAEGGALSL